MSKRAFYAILVIIIAGIMLGVSLLKKGLNSYEHHDHENYYPLSIMALRDCQVEGKIGKELPTCIDTKIVSSTNPKEEKMGKKNKPKPKE